MAASSASPPKPLPWRLCPLKVASFNVRGLSAAYKKEALARDLRQHHIDVCCLQETKVREELDQRVGDFRLITFTPDQPQRGMGFMVGPRLQPYLERAWQVEGNDRVAAAAFRLPLLSGDVLLVKVINCYGPTAVVAKRDPEEREHFYDTVERVLRSFSNNGYRTVIVIAGDFNAKVGQRERAENISCLGRYSKGTRNENGEHLINLAEENNLVIANTCFKHSKRHQTTWQGVAPNGHIIFNQIDYILIKQDHRSFLKQARSIAGTETTSDHRLLICELDLRQMRVKWAAKGKRSEKNSLLKIFPRKRKHSRKESKS